MPDRQDINQRLQALEALERAQALKAQGYMEEALAAAQRSVAFMPSLDPAQALVAELQQSAEAPSLSEDDQVGQLMQGLGASERNGQWDRVIALAEAILSLAPKMLSQIKTRIAHACQQLISASRTQDIEASLSWAKTWQRLSNDPEATATYRQLHNALRQLNDVEQELQQAIKGKAIEALRAAMTPLEVSPDRTRGCLALFQRATQELNQRETAAARLRAEIASLGSSDLDRSCLISRQLSQLDGTEQSLQQRDSLHQRAQVVAEREEQLRHALATNNSSEIATAIAAIEHHEDRLSGTDDLIEEARQRLVTNDDEVDQLRDDFDGVSTPADLPTRIRIAERLALLAPDDERVEELAELRHRWEQLQEQCDTLETLIAEQDDPHALIHEGRRLSQNTEQTVASRDIAHKAVEIGESLLVRSQQRRRVLVLAVSLLVALGILAAVNRLEVNRIANRDPSLDVVDTLRSYPLYPWHIFSRSRAQHLAENMHRQLDRAAFNAARDETETAIRVRLLKNYLDTYPSGVNRAEAEQDLARSEGRLIRQAFTDALADDNPERQHERLEKLLAIHAEHPVAAWALSQRAAQQRAADRKAWQACLDEEDLEEQIRLIKAYLERPDPLHVEEALAAQIEAERQFMQARIARDDEQAWQEALSISNPTQRFRALLTYREATANQERQIEAQNMIRALAKELDDAAWAATQVEDPQERRAALRRYLEATDLPQRDYLEAATDELAIMDRDHDASLWQPVLRAAGPTQEQVAIEAYLKSTELGLFRDEAARRLKALGRQEAESDWLTVSSVSDPVRRLSLLDEYRSKINDPLYVDRAERRISSTINDIARLPDAVLQGLPILLLARMPAARLLECHDSLLAPLGNLPLTQLEGLDARVLARLPRPAIRRLSVSRAARVAVQPPWADDAGNDQYGRWASVTLDDVSWRFRYLFPGALGAEAVVHRGVWLLEHEITRQQWATVVGARSDPSRLPGNEQHPVDHVRWRDVSRFISRFADQTDSDDAGVWVRLPTQDEMLLVIRSINTGPLVAPYPSPTEDPTQIIAATAWRHQQSNDEQHSVPVRHLEPDAWGLYGVLGNVGEWLHDDPPPDQTRYRWFLDASFSTRVDALWPQPPIISINERDILPQAGFRIAITDTAD